MGLKLNARWYRSSTRTGAEKRNGTRTPIDYRAHLRTGDGKAPLGPCKIMDISTGGARLRVERDPADLPSQVILILSAQAKTFRRCEIKWRSPSEIGVEFLRR